MENLAIYIHWPFCKSKCPYCDFNSHVNDNIDQEKWLSAYLKEIEFFHPQLKDRKITSIFFGGGTPSLMPAKTVEKIIEKISTLWPLAENVEITAEANPTSVEAQKLADFKKAGINRVSLGVQSLVQQDLKFLGRQHNAGEAIDAIKTAAKIFDNYSFDLIYARPQQKLFDWKNELDEAIKLSRNHLSIYQLTIEKGTEFYSLYNKGGFVLPDNNQAADFYEVTQEICEKNNLPAYEISNHAKIGFECRHNITYWEYGEYLGIGPGAHGRLKPDNKTREATMMIHDPANWIKSVSEKGHGLQSQEKISGDDFIKEFMLMGLRLKTGIRKQNFRKIFGRNPEEFFAGQKLDLLQKERMIEFDDEYFKATPKGLMVLNSINLMLLPEAA